MQLKKLASHIVHAVRRQLGQPLPSELMARYQIAREEKEALANQASGDLAKTFFAQRGRIVHKWVHYLEIYERHFAPFRNTPVRMLEIGVSKGGSLQMWREYFGEKATIFGIDIDPDCVHCVSVPNQVRIGSQDDPDFLKSVVAEMGSPDIILDDGSHVAPHQRTSFDTLFPSLKYGGLYAIEDLHTAYWPGSYGGGYRRAGTAIEHVKEMIDDLHTWYHQHATTTPAKHEIGAIHIYDSIAVIEKVRKQQPGHIQVG